MAVKIYDASAGAFKDAPTPQIYDASAQAYKESTGLVYDTSKGAWDERWRGVIAYVYGAVQEIITIKRAGIAVKQVTTDSTGRSTEQIRLGCGTYDLIGSVSGWTETQTVDQNTERFRAMPEGALYWYGNECIDVTGGIETYVYSSGTNKITKNINNIYFNLGNYSVEAEYNNAIAVAKNRNSVGNFKRIYFNTTNIFTIDLLDTSTPFNLIASGLNMWNVYLDQNNVITESGSSLNNFGKNRIIGFGLIYGANVSTTVSAVWLE